MPFFPQRIVSLQPSASVILDALGTRRLLVACTKYCEEVLPGISQGRLVVADSWASKAAEILAAQPELVIASVPYQLESVGEILKSGIPFLGLAPKTLDDIYRDIGMIAGIVGRPEAGVELIASMQNTIDAVREKVRAHGSGSPQVFCEEWGKPLIASQPWVAELVQAAGGEFVGQPGQQTTSQAVLARDPDYVIAAWCGAGDRVPLEKIVAQRSWGQMRAVREKHVYCIPDPWLNTPAPTLLQGLHAIAAILHPQLFPQPSAVRRLGPPGP
ncbi:MAG TPA: ABC transporter substrate-binding protein [Terriglobales bacterium]|jgi:iron complex transport system substrate-binding protein|nr:ABC transporter substrate-binding protein [Terriglobales bacterium]